MATFEKIVSGIKGLRRKTTLKHEEDVPEMEISSPTMVTHEWKVTYDPTTKEFIGMPPIWQALLATANIR